MALLDQVFVDQYGSNVYVMAQQRMSRLRPYVRIEPMKGVKRFFDRVHKTNAVRVDSRYGDTPLIQTPFSRRALMALEYIWADMVDWQDELNILIDPKSSIVEMGAAALGRTLDEIIIKDAFLGPSYNGEEGLDVQPFPEKQKIPVTFGGSSAANTGLNIEKLVAIRSMFGKADVDLEDPANKIHMAITQQQLDDLVANTDIKNKDYEMIKDLGAGKTNEFYGIHFVHTGLLPATDISGGKSRMCPAWCQSGVILGEPKSITMSLDPRPDKNNNWQALAKMKAGACRIEDAKVLQVYCFEKEVA